MQLTVLNESQLSTFKFWLDKEIHDGLLYGNELFRCLHTLTPPRQGQAYSLGYALREQGVQALITCQGDRHRVWVSLRAPWQQKTSKAQQLDTLTSSNLFRA